MSAGIGDNPFSLCGLFKHKKLHLGISGSIACYRAADLLRAWLSLGMNVSATLTAGAREFISPTLIKALGAAPVYGEMFAPDGDVFGHLEPGRQSDCMAIVPASAGIISRLARGAASDMLSAQALAFGGPLLIAPAMNPRMWANAATRENARLLRQRGHQIVQPGHGGTACGETGQGRLAELPEIFLQVLRALSAKDMAGLNVLVTLGPTREAWDGVRFWSNPSSGKMGCAMATCAWLRGASVTAICGPGVSIALPQEIDRINVESAGEMFAAAETAWPRTDIGIFCAAVADFAPEKYGEGKFRKDHAPENLSINFHANPDILRTLAAAKRPGQRILGFAAEICRSAKDLLPLAQSKLERKKADIIAANRVNPGGAFGASRNVMAVADAAGTREIWPEMPKADVAWELCSWLLRI